MHSNSHHPRLGIESHTAQGVISDHYNTWGFPYFLNH
jgi:hypothetical protein